MGQRLVIVTGRSSQLLYGDLEFDDQRFTVADDAGDDTPGALPVLIQEGWEVKSVHPLGSPTNAALVLLSKG